MSFQMTFISVIWRCFWDYLIGVDYLEIINNIEFLKIIKKRLFNMKLNNLFKQLLTQNNSSLLIELESSDVFVVT